ncbi:MAG: LacI family transcriptional regulator [Spirochaetaceae bacterium]|jgi:LacI family transcriptional regulator|nr:LacI family transcriptional regulator [Spirochaetaceae bacterium]
MVNIKDIAKRVGMSPSTVSRVVNDKKYVNPKKREQILKLIEETGYVPNQAARNMVLQRSFTVGIILADTFNMFQRQLFSFVERHLGAFGYNTHFFFVKFEGSSEEECLAKLKAEKLDGIIMIHEIQQSSFYESVKNLKLPLVTATFNHPDFPSVHVDEENAAYEAVRHLLNLGHRKIKMISSNGLSCGVQRAEGFLRALETAGIERNVEEQIVFVRQYTAEFGIYGMRELLLRSRDFSAVFAATDELAIGAMRVLKDEGFRIPEDISVVGFDDLDISNYFMPRLTTIHQPLIEIGERTAQALHKYISSGNRVGTDMVLPHKLIIRESTRALTS